MYEYLYVYISVFIERDEIGQPSFGVSFSLERLNKKGWRPAADPPSPPPLHQDLSSKLGISADQS